MPNQRSKGKRMLGFYATPAIQQAIDKWRERHEYMPSRTQFLLLAAMEKLRRDGVEVSARDALHDGRFAGCYPAHEPSNMKLNETKKK